MNEDKLNEFLGKFVTDLGATVAAGNVVIGHRLGLYARSPPGPPPPSNSPRAPAPHPATSPNGCAARQRAAISPGTLRRTATR